MNDTTHTHSVQARSIIDCHVHIVGNGFGGSGCVLKLRSYQPIFARIMLRELGLPTSALRGALEDIYVRRLTEFVEQSSMRAIVILAHEHVRDENGAVIENFSSMYVPNDFVLSLCRTYHRFLPGVSIHPARPDALDELDRCIENGAVLMKCLPNCQNIDLSDKRFIPFYERMAKAGLPLLAHTGGELAVPVYQARYADPRFLELPLEVGVTVIAAHCGTSAHYFDPNFTDTFAEMLYRYPRLYGDNSGLMTPFRSRHLPALLKEPIRSRVVYGSDIPVSISAWWAFLRGLINSTQLRECNATKNPLERDIILKRALGFPEDSFMRLNELLLRSPAVDYPRN